MTAGRCLCGAISYRFDARPEAVVLCHHRNRERNLRDRQFCCDCGTPIFTVLHERPDILLVKAGTLDDRAGLNPSVEVWCRREQDWIAPDSNRLRFAGDAR